MKLGLHVSDFTWPGGPEKLGDHLTAIAQAAEAAGFDRISVMDHFFQIRFVGSVAREMLDAYTTLGAGGNSGDRIADLGRRDGGR